jgi:hypothetical protein
MESRGKRQGRRVPGVLRVRQSLPSISPCWTDGRHLPRDYWLLGGGGSDGGGASAGVSGEVVVLGGVVLGSPEFPPGVVDVSPAPEGVVVVESLGVVGWSAESRGPQAASSAVAAQRGMRSLGVMRYSGKWRGVPNVRVRVQRVTGRVPFRNVRAFATLSQLA